MAACIYGLCLNVHATKTHMETACIGHDGAINKPSRNRVVLRTRLIGAGSKCRVVGKCTILEPQVVVGYGVHHTNAAAWLVNVAFGFVQILFLSRTISRRKSEWCGVVTGTQEVVLVETVL